MSRKFVKYRFKIADSLIAGAVVMLYICAAFSSMAH